jgi:hypothetical protein
MSNFKHKYGDWEITYVAGANEWQAAHPDGRTKRSAQGLLALQAAIDKVATVEKKFERFDVFIFPRYHGDTVTKGTVTSYEGNQEARVSKASGERYGPKTKSEAMRLDYLFEINAKSEALVREYAEAEAEVTKAEAHRSKVRAKLAEHAPAVRDRLAKWAKENL